MCTETTTIGGGGGGGGDFECEEIDDFEFREHKGYTPVFFFQDDYTDPVVSFFSSELGVEIIR